MSVYDNIIIKVLNYMLPSEGNPPPLQDIVKLICISLLYLIFCTDNDVIVFSVRVTSISEVFQCGSKCIQLRDSQGSALLTFDNQNG